MKEQIEGLVERFGSLGSEERSVVRDVLGRYAEGEMGMDEAHYLLLDEDLIPMPSRCTMYHKPEITTDAEEALKALIREKVLEE